MAQVFRWLLRIAGGMVVLTLLALFGVYFLAARSLPDYDASHRVDGVSAPVEIVRDNANVPHVLGQSDPDVFFGLGYAHAQDRLWQMVVLRRTAQGRLSEVFGLRTVEIDKLMRRLDIQGAARDSVAAQDPETLAALEAYAAGINARLGEINERALGRGAPEMFLFNPAIAPWQPADSIALLKLMALRMSGQLEAEVRRARVSLVLPDPARVSDILPDAPGSGVAALPDYASLFDGPLPPQRLASAAGRRPDHPLWPVARPGMQGASNVWAAAPERSAAGGTILANDPHLPLSAPAIWYLARLELSSGGVIGATIPGIPAILSGRSEDLGWGIAASYLDDQDLFVERMNPDAADQYETPDGFKPFETRRAILRIKDASPVTMTLRWTDNGPVLPRSDFNLDSITPRGHVMALSWTGLDPNDQSIGAWLRLMRARTVQDAISATDTHLAPSLNLVVVDGVQIAMKTIGAAPRRDADHQSQGRMPAPGWEDRNRWKGLSPYSSNPVFLQPPGGIVGATNNKIVDRPFPLHVSYHWGDTQRVQRWTRLMQSRQVHTRDSFIEAQLDTVSPTARTLLPLIGADLWFTGETAPDGTPERQRQRALSLLADWNGEMNEHLPEPLIYAAWVRALQDRLIRDELGPLARDFTHVEPLFIERVFRDVGGAGAWCDVIQSAPVETCTDMARLALEDAIIWLEENHGTALESLRWGDAHQATHQHDTLGEVPLLSWVVNIRQSTSGGDNTLRRGLTRGTGPAPFENVHAAGYRGVYDFTDPDSSVFVIATGQSGHPLSRYYDDMGELWRRGEYIPMSLDLDLARAAAVGVTRLLPRQPRSE
ncbi:penicillin acylase family protein [Lutimaribacter sp. EGI FJ00015]|uniref:Penicillin acylase family protein n=1 Tax=Lutimaribacter degradans TaxID=2945989 RepID=A0ACC5ZS81_9RHOB|nr:penicillin acylase family protein [Lutimaribacter sp. EGI FJ00013]MCM2561172.1 penicillin acylase family protein [Lutimaribacter sp. EGI FJ00013]MCO0611879.1 penicillin acylase family protein [Lutimaribacter sp. EGI FJ00015]MCO0635000.1 penicillin acylase family protein [Lutimaribacter sp. EGI FJ00014]